VDEFLLTLQIEDIPWFFKNVSSRTGCQKCPEFQTLSNSVIKDIKRKIIVVSAVTKSGVLSDRGIAPAGGYL
jgi:hypothetical protein